MENDLKEHSKEKNTNNRIYNTYHGPLSQVWISQDHDGVRI